MKHILTLLALVMLYTTNSMAIANTTELGIKFHSLTWQQAQEKAQAENKSIFIDFYATWCGPCKYMEDDVFTNTEVGAYFNANFISLRIDAEKEELALVESINLEAYPTLVFFDAKGNQMVSQVGVLEPMELINFGKKAANYQKAFLAYKASPNDYYNIGNYLNYVSESQAQKANDIALGYLQKLDKPTLKTAESWQIIKYITDYNSDIITYVYNNPTYYSSLTGYDTLSYTLMNFMLKDAASQESLAILSQLKKFEITYLKAVDELERPAAFYNLVNDLLYYQHTEDIAKYAELLNTQCHTYYWDDEEELASNAMYFAEAYYEEDEAFGVKSKALDWVQRSRELNDTTWFTYFAEAMVYYHFSEYKKALPMARKALAQKDTSDPELQTSLSNFIEDLLELTDYEG